MFISFGHCIVLIPFKSIMAIQLISGPAKGSFEKSTPLQIIRLNRTFFVVTRELFSLQLKPIIHSRAKPVVSERSIVVAIFFYLNDWDMQ